MFQKLSRHPLIAGSFLLTITGFVSRLIGFFYRIYLSRTFGEEGMGVYQLISPVMALSFSLTAAGFQTAISKFVAETTVSVGSRKRASIRPMIMGLSVSLPVSLLVMLILMRFSEPIAVSWLGEPRTVALIRILALSIPLSAIHACINGYFYGLKKAMVPATAQIIEQCSRVAGVYLCSLYYLSEQQTPPLSITVLGLVIGEFVSTLVAALCLLHSVARKPAECTDFAKPSNSSSENTLPYKSLLLMVLPLIANRVTLNALQSIETVSLPACLKIYGYDHATALSVYGVLTGMAFPLIFFPNAITGSIAVLLLPLISEETARGNKKGVQKLTVKTIQYCSLLGFACMTVFLFFGKALGTLLFQSDLAGYFISGLSFICPFIYLNSTLSAILQGMGKVITLFFVNVTALLIRLLFIYFFVPSLGIQGYLWGLLMGQIFTSTAYLLTILKRKILPHSV